MKLWHLIVLSLISYLFGSLNFAIIVSRLFKHDDIRNHGSGNAGITNYFRTFHSGSTIAVVIGDVGKCLLAVLVGGVMYGNLGKFLAGLWVMLGHMFPLYFGFKGGKGVLTTAALLLAFDWRMFLICLAVFLGCVIPTRWVSLGSIASAFAVPFCVWFLYQDWRYVTIAAIIAAIIIFMHRANIKRILNGTESRLSFGKK